MAIKRSAGTHAIPGLCIGMIGCFTLIRTVAAAAPATYTVAFDWADDRSVKEAVPSGMVVEISIGANTTETTDMFAYAVWQEQANAQVALNTLVVEGNGSKCISYTSATPAFPGDYKSCGVVSIDNDSSRTLELISEWARKQPPLYTLKVHIKFTLELTSDSCKAKLISASRNYDDRPNETIPFTAVIKEECKREGN